MQRRSFLAMSAALACLTSVAFAPAANAVTTGQAQALVEQVSQQVINLIKTPGDAASKAPQLRSIMEQNFAVRSAAGFALGRYKRSANAAQRDRYVDVYSNYIARTYANRFNEYGGETISVTNSQDFGDRGVYVSSQVNSKGQLIQIGWQVRDDQSGQPKIYDINVEGLSMAESQRSEFTRKLSELGGNVDAFTNWLESAI